MAGRTRLFLWRHQRSLTILYLGILAIAWTGFLAFSYGMPDTYDVGMAVAARAAAYRASFEDVRVARRDIADGRLADARKRLEGFLDAHRNVQRSQLQTHAVAEAYELLADLHMRRDRPRQAIRLLKELTERLPLHYRAWHLRGLAEKRGAGGDVAAASLDRAFRLALNNVDVTDDYLGVLADLSATDRILWVADQFERAARRAAPTAVVKVGVPRGSMQRRALEWAGIPIEQGTFFRSFEVRGLERGAGRVIACPPEVFLDWPDSGGTITVQVRFEHVYGGLRVEALRCRVAGKTKVYTLKDGDVRRLHRPHDAREAYGEFDLELDPTDGEGYEIVYSCPEHKLSAESLAIIDKARANRKRRGS